MNLSSAVHPYEPQFKVVQEGKILTPSFPAVLETKSQSNNLAIYPNMGSSESPNSFRPGWPRHMSECLQNHLQNHLQNIGQET